MKLKHTYQNNLMPRFQRTSLVTCFIPEAVADQDFIVADLFVSETGVLLPCPLISGVRCNNESTSTFSNLFGFSNVILVVM